MTMPFSIWSVLIVSVNLLLIAASPVERRGPICKKTNVAILGAGTAGITAGQALSNASVTDFLIIEYNNETGGRVAHTNFGKKADGSLYVVELGANWVQGLGTPPGPENPIWTLAKRYNVTNTLSDYTSIQTYNQNGAVDYTSLLTDYQNAYAIMEQDAGYILSENLQDRSVRPALSLAGWKPRENMEAQATEWWQFDWEYANTPEQSSEEFAIVNYNTTFYQYSAANNYVYDQRGFNTFIKGLGSTYLKKNDSRLLLNTIVTNVSYTKDGVTVTNSDGSCIDADYAICTFSLGVLQNDAVTFTPTFPTWKQNGIETFTMATYTKIFLQFPRVFWPASTQFFLYADPLERGYFPVFQSLDAPGFLVGSGILFVTVVAEQSYRVEKQDDETTKQQVMAVLRKMFGDVPEPTAFMYPRWSQVPWAYGSYSNWPPGTTLEMHQNLRANVGRLWFAGEHTSSEYFGFLHGAYFEGQAAAQGIAKCLKGSGGCKGEVNYKVLHGTTPASDYNPANGWDVTSFQTYGFGGGAGSGANGSLSR